VDILELKFHYPLRALRDERRADGAFAKNPRSAVQPLVEDGGRPIWSERLPVRSGAGAGVVQFTGESRDDVSAEAVAVERSGARRPRRRGFAGHRPSELERLF
jgi:hypothetical protein